MYLCSSVVASIDWEINARWFLIFRYRVFCYFKIWPFSWFLVQLLSYHEEMNFLIRHILHVLHLRSSQFPIICLLYEPSLFYTVALSLSFQLFHISKKKLQQWLPLQKNIVLPKRNISLQFEEVILLLKRYLNVIFDMKRLQWKE